MPSPHRFVDDHGNVFAERIEYQNVIHHYYQGSTYGYTAGGTTPPATAVTVIERFPFATGTTNATDTTADLLAVNSGLAGLSTDSYGYTAGGSQYAPPVGLNTIQRWPWAVTTDNAADVGDITSPQLLLGLNSSVASPTWGYVLGGYNYTPGVAIDNKEGFPFALSAVDAIDINNIDTAKYNQAGAVDGTYGYYAGGRIAPGGGFSTIYRFPFANWFNNTSTYGNLTTTMYNLGAAQSTEYAYVLAGLVPPATYRNNIERWPFAYISDGASDIGDLIVTAAHRAGTSSTEYGYAMGGQPPPPSTYSDTIDRFPFAASVTDASDVGNLTAARYGTAGHLFY